MLIAIDYANEKYRRWQTLTTESAYRFGAEKVVEYSPESLPKEFCEKNKRILEQPRGAGYWIWKPYIIKDALKKANDGDIVMYIDSGVVILDDLQYLITAMNDAQTDIAVFETVHIEKTWSKRDAFILMDCDKPEFAETPQRMATSIIFKKCQNSLAFVDEWQRYMEDERIVTDIPNQLGVENYDTFRENRHDQTALSLLSKKWGIQAFRIPNRPLSPEDKSVFSEGVWERSQYPQIMYFIKHYKSNRDISLDEALELYSPRLMPLTAVKTAIRLLSWGMENEAVMILMKFRAAETFRRSEWRFAMPYLLQLLNKTANSDRKIHEMAQLTVYEIILEYSDNELDIAGLAGFIPIFDELSKKAEREKLKPVEQALLIKLNQYVDMVYQQKDQITPELDIYKNAILKSIHRREMTY